MSQKKPPRSGAAFTLLYKIRSAGLHTGHGICRPVSPEKSAFERAGLNQVAIFVFGGLDLGNGFVPCIVDMLRDLGVHLGEEFLGALELLNPLGTAECEKILVVGFREAL